MDKIKVIGFDADDTLWICEPIFRNAEEKICKLLSPWMERESLLKKILDVHVRNMPLYGYGIKGYVLSLTEAALEISDGNVSQDILTRILEVGKEMIQEPVVLINDVKTILPKLKENYKLLVITKGDLLDQERKLELSGLLPYFDGVEIMSDKKTEDYHRLFDRLQINPSEFMMVGNSIRSDIQPVMALGARGVHIPYEITWAHEKVDDFDKNNPLFSEIQKMEELYKLLN